MKDKKRVEVVVWVCRECGNYFGSTSAGDLSSTLQTTKRNKPQIPRSRCPNLACQAKEIDREPVRIFV